MGYSGGYLDSGLAGIAGERYAADRLRVPEKVAITQTAHGGTTRALYGPPPKLSKVYGQVALEEIEGHQVDPYYDVRGSGLGQVSTLTRRNVTAYVPAPSSVEALPSEKTPESPPALLFAGLAFVVWRMLKKMK